MPLSPIDRSGFHAVPLGRLIGRGLLPAFTALLGWVAAPLDLGAAGADSKQPAPKAGDIMVGEPFSADRVLEVEITLPPHDWNVLRKQSRDVNAEFTKDRLQKPAVKPYTWFKADVRIQGVPIKDVGVRKRGFFGSADENRPALNINLELFVPGRKIAGHGELKLHNNRQDPAQIRQLLAYKVFAAAKAPAPRCGLARVTVNGQNLGIYSLIEPIDEAFLDRHFSNSTGNLYEAAISDFRPGWTDTFEQKNNKDKPTRKRLESIAATLQMDDDHLLPALEKLLDVDAFIRFWAVESLLNHWDGFAGNQNNAFVYEDANSGRLRFIAWGADATFGIPNIFPPFTAPASVWAVSLLPRRLYNHPVTQQRYRAQMKQLLETAWNEKDLLGEADRIEQLVKNHVTIPAQLMQGSLAAFRQFVKDRRTAIEAELGAPAKPWNHPLRREIYMEDVGQLRLEFSTEKVASVMSPTPKGAKARFELRYYERPYAVETTEVKVIPDPEHPDRAAVLAVAMLPGVPVPIVVWCSIDSKNYETGKKLEVGSDIKSTSVMAGQAGSDNFRFLGFGQGTLELDSVGTGERPVVKGILNIKIRNLPWEEFDLSKLAPFRPR